MAIISYFSAEQKKVMQFEVKDEIYNRFLKAIDDYQTSYKIIRQYYYYLWCAAYKDYELSTYDRSVKIKPWQNNIPYGLIRQTIDVFISSILEKPFKFSAFGINKKGVENRQNVEHMLNTNSDRTKLHSSIILPLQEGLIIGNFCLKTEYVKQGEKINIIDIVNGQVVETEVETENINNPVSYGCDMFNIFPDMSTGKMQYITERGVSSLYDFKCNFLNLINSNDNSIKDLVTDDYLNSLILDTNAGSANFDDFGKIRMMIYEKENELAKEANNFELESKALGDTTGGDFDQDLGITSGKIEWRLTTYNNKVVLNANGYPVYIGKNKYNKINYEIGTAFPTRLRLGLGIAYMLRGYEKTGVSYLNNFMDGVRATANPTYIANKSLLLSERTLRNAEPGGVLYADTNNDPRTSIFRLDKGTVTDNGLLGIVDGKAQTLAGTSDYNLGISARERTSGGANALVESSLKRMTQYVQRFANTLGDVGEFWLKLMREYWTEEQYLAYSDEDGNEIIKELKGSNAEGIFNISLQSQGMLSLNKDLELKRILEAYNLTAGSGKVNVDEVIAQIYRLMGYNVNKFVPQIGKDANIPEDRKNKNFSEIADAFAKSEQGIGGDMNEEVSQEGGQAMSGQVDMGNNGAGQSI